MAEWEECKNPVLNELVIDNISKYLSFEELKVCRGLNHLWKKTTNKIFLKRCPPIFLNSPYKNGCKNKEVKMTIAQFMEIYTNLEHPHQHAQLLRQYRNFFLLGLDKDCIPIFYNFMSQVGPQMTSLAIIFSLVFRDSQDLMDIVSSKYTPNLEELFLKVVKIGSCQKNDINRVCVDGKENRHLRRLTVFSVHYTIQWSGVFTLYPKLKALSIINVFTNVLEEIAIGLVTVRKANETKLNITELELRSFPITETEETKADWLRIGDLLKNANLPLEKLSLYGFSSEFKLALIEHYSENSKTLTLRNMIPQPLPVMRALKEMCKGRVEIAFFNSA